MPDAEGSAGEVTRRRALRLGVAGLGAAGIASIGVAGCGDVGPADAHLAFAERTLMPRPLPPAPAAVRTSQPVHVRAKPVHTLSDYMAKPPAHAVVLTIDDGPSPTWTPKVLELLRLRQVTATFCLIGEQVRKRPDLARRIVDDGHTVCNHTMSHPMGMGKLSAARVEHEIGEANEIIAEATGTVPRVFRSPGGSWGPAVLAAAAKHGLVPIDWAIDPRDWALPGKATIVRRMLAAQPGQIMLCHDGGGNRAETVAALRTVIPALQHRGLRFVAL
jgi:peptidoglycan/xylan/chitin deacetylase (PgdA/CDA1 family)